MFMCFLNASKAFDKAKHYIISEFQLIDRGVPGYIFRLFIYWYLNHTVYKMVM